MYIYEDIYHILEVYVYNGNLDEFARLSCTLISTCACIFLVALPFLVVWKIIKLLLN